MQRISLRKHSEQEHQLHGHDTRQRKGGRLIIKPTYARKALSAYLDPQQAPQSRFCRTAPPDLLLTECCATWHASQLISDKFQPAARRREGIMSASLCFIMHILQTSMTDLLASSLHWLPGGGNCWPSTLHELSAFHQVIAKPTASSRHLILGGRQPRPRTPPASACPDALWGTRNALLNCEGVAVTTRSRCQCASLKDGGEGYEGQPVASGAL